MGGQKNLHQKEGLESDIQFALAPMREQLASLADLESRLVTQLEQKASESTGVVETRLDANIARSQQRVEQRVEARLSEVRQDLAKDFQAVKESLESDREQVSKINDQLWICMEE